MLREAREAKSLTVHQIADITKIKTEHVRALEDGNFDVFSAPIYIRGFVRSYAQAVRLDTQKLMQQLDSELSLTENLNAPPSLTGPQRGFLDHILYYLSQLNWRIIAPILGIALIVSVIVWGYRALKEYQAHDPLSDLGPGLYQPPEKNSGETLPLPPPNDR